MAFRLSFFKTPKHHVFNYTPRYYDPQQERAEELRSLTSKDAEMMSDTVRHRHLRSRMHQGFQQAAYHNRRNAGNRIIIRLIVLLTLLILLIAIYYSGPLLELLFTAHYLR